MRSECALHPRHAGRGPVALLVAAPLGELGLRLAPAREVARDQLAVGTCAGEPAAREIDGAELLVVRGRGAQLGIASVLELAAAAGDEPLGEREALGRRLARRFGARGLERTRGELGTLACGVEPALRFACIADRIRKISAA